MRRPLLLLLILCVVTAGAAWHWQAASPDGNRLFAMINDANAAADFQVVADGPAGVSTKIVAADFELPWDLVPLDESRILVSEKQGGLWVVDLANGKTSRG